MNRITALLLAMATLLAHTLAIHLTPEGQLAQPYEYVHGAFTLARHAVRDGVWAWNVGASGAQAAGLEAYPSPLWLAVAWVAERAYLPVNRFAQVVGILAALVTVAYSARFDVDRLAGVVPPLLLVTSGAFAAAGASGSEVTSVALLLTMTLVAYQLHRPFTLALASALLVLARPEGVLFVLAVCALGVVDRLRRRLGRAHRLTVPPWWVPLPAAVATLALCLVRDGRGGSLYGGLLGQLLLPDAARASRGLSYLGDFALTTVVPVLLVFPVLALAAGRLSGTGARALALAAAWITSIVLRGGGPSPFTLDLVPALPLIGIAVQQGIVAGLDSGVRALERVAWGLLLPASLLATLASKFPPRQQTNFLARAHAAWLDDGLAEPECGNEPRRGRPSLGIEIQRTARLRALGRFLREYVDPSLSILTPWPGTIGYLSGLRVLDFLGRVTPPVGDVRTSPLEPRPRIDLVAQLERGADLVLPGAASMRDATFGRGSNGLDPALLALDVHRGTLENLRRVQVALERYELVAVPVVAEQARPSASPTPFYLLRRRDLGLAPRLEIQVLEGDLVVRVAGIGNGSLPGHPQLARLEITLEDELGKTWYLDPCGRATGDAHLFARTDLRLAPVSGGRALELYRGPLPELEGAARVRAVGAQLFNPLLRKAHRLAEIGEAARVEVP